MVAEETTQRQGDGGSADEESLWAAWGQQGEAARDPDFERREPRRSGERKRGERQLAWPSALTSIMRPALHAPPAIWTLLPPL